MSTHTHGADGAPEHSHGGSARGLGWELLDSIVLGCACVIACILAELLYKQWQASRVRYDLTPEGRAATEARHAAEAAQRGPLVDLDALAEAVANDKLGTDQQ